MDVWHTRSRSVFVLSLVAWAVRVPLGASEASAQVACPCSIFTVLDTPAIPVVADSQPIELGVKFRAEQDGNVLGVRFFKGGPANGGTHVGRLRGPDGSELAVATFVGESTTGWQEVRFSEPVQVLAGVTYIASYHVPQGNYAVTHDYFVTPRLSTPLIAVASGPAGGNGVFLRGDGSLPPTQTDRSANYWVDVVFEGTGPLVNIDIVAPTVTGRSPAASATNVPRSSTISATFSEPIVGDSAQLVATSSSGTVAGSLTFDEATSTVMLTPASLLAANRIYTVTVSGGRDVSGNIMAPTSWTFRTSSDATAPTVSGRLPASGATNVAVATIVRATFSEPVIPETAQLSLTSTAGSVTGTLSYDAATRRLTLTPSAPLAWSTAYTATVSGARDPNGNVMVPAVLDVHDDPRRRDRPDGHRAPARDQRERTSIRRRP